MNFVCARFKQHKRIVRESFGKRDFSHAKVCAKISATGRQGLNNGCWPSDLRVGCAGGQRHAFWWPVLAQTAKVTSRLRWVWRQAWVLCILAGRTSCQHVRMFYRFQPLFNKELMLLIEELLRLERSPCGRVDAQPIHTLLTLISQKLSQSCEPPALASPSCVKAAAWGVALVRAWALLASCLGLL